MNDAATLEWIRSIIVQAYEEKAQSIRKDIAAWETEINQMARGSQPIFIEYLPKALAELRQEQARQTKLELTYKHALSLLAKM